MRININNTFWKEETSETSICYQNKENDGTPFAVNMSHMYICDENRLSLYQLVTK